MGREYLSPNVYIEDTPNAPVVSGVSSSTGGFIGVAQRGKVGEPVFITSWNQYIEEFADKMDSPFISNSDLAYSVYGFFQNGGKRCYVIRAIGEQSATAKATHETTLKLEAKDEGKWADDKAMKFSVTANADTPTNFDLVIKFGAEEVERFSNLSNKTTDDNYWIDTVNMKSALVKAISGDLKVASDVAFTGGKDGNQITDNDFTKLLSAFDTVDDVNLLAIPGQTSPNVNNALMSYAENRTNVFALLDAPKASTVTSVKALRKTMSCKNACLLFPFIRVTDPLSKVGKLRDCPTAGHVMGVFARTIQERGVHKAPAGTETTIRGAIEVVTTLNDGDVDVLNPLGIISIMPKTNYGIVVWGARTLHPDSSMKYISDVLLDIMIKKSIYIATQPFVFEPNNHATWARVTTTVESFLDTLWREGALFGKTAKEAYYVKCDEETNTKAIRDQGKMITEVGYASNKPAEFVIFRFSHNIGKN